MSAEDAFAERHGYARVDLNCKHPVSLEFQALISEGIEHLELVRA